MLKNHRIVLYSHDGKSYGHISKLGKFSSALVNHNSSLSVYCISSSPFSNYFIKPFCNIDYLWNLNILFSSFRIVHGPSSFGRFSDFSRSESGIGWDDAEDEWKQYGQPIWYCMQKLSKIVWVKCHLQFHIPHCNIRKFWVKLNFISFKPSLQKLSISQ